ncbi:MAG TPA: threonine-phosphate decarboxylase CobD [Nitrospira sp.]|nr:threonine-phosphate decarboxylase CobD [Nitrospira sp.]
MNDEVVHGGNVYAAAEELGRPIGSLRDFSASINALGPSPKAIRVLVKAANLIHHYPDPDCTSLKRAVACQWKLSPDQFVVGNGSSELIDLIPRTLSLRSALVVGPTYGEYARAVHRAGGRVSMVFARKEERYRPPLEEVTHKLAAQRSARAGIDSVFICHPNSPTGQPCRLDELAGLLRIANRANVWVIVDESFIDYCGALTCVPQLASFPRLIILRSFTKFYGLPGLRIGYSLSSRTVAELLKQSQPPWSVNVLAQRAAHAALCDRDHARRSLAYTLQERSRLVERLSSVPDLTVIPSAANFLLLELPGRILARTIAARLRRQGMLIRDCSSIVGCSHRTIRIAVRTKNENDRLLAALEQLLGES